ncbi:MAG TPA: hypothetical protein VMZ53_01460 [Kofleriaceae bacterium]|nr:hypothetical protein [Kofleriaceae bacterium]
MKTLTCGLALMLAVAAGCKGNSKSSGDGLAKLSGFKDEMCRCKDAACAQDVSSKMTTWTQEQAKGDHAGKLSDSDTAKAQKISDELGACMAKAMTATAGGGSAAVGSAGSAAPVDPAAFKDLPQDCLDYRATVDKLASCGDKLPADVRDTLKQRFDESVQGWAKLPPEAKKSLGPACKAGVQAVEANAKAQCGW